MAASYPASAKSFSTKATNDVIEPAHVNDLQDEVAAVEGGLINGVAHHIVPDVNNTRNLGSDAKRFANVYATTLTVAGGTFVLDNSIDDFRLTLQSGVPVSITDQLAKTTLYCTPYRGNRFALYDASGNPTILTSAEFSIAVPATTAQVYSAFVYNNAGVATLELTAWTNDTTPGAAAYTQSVTLGILTKTGDLTRRFVGLLRTTSVSGQTEDSEAKHYLWNAYNQAPRVIRKFDTTASWTYSTATIRQADGAAANQAEFIIGIADVLVSARYSVVVANDQASIQPHQIGIGLDSITVFTSPSQAHVVITGPAASQQVSGTTFVDLYPAIGFHYLAMLERGTGTATSTWYGASTYAGAAVMLGSYNG